MSAESTVETTADIALRLLRTIARPLILARFRKDSCIVSTAVACEFLRWAGVRAKPIELEVLAYNAAAVELVRAGVPASEWPDEAWSVGITQTSDVKPSHWQGAHLCTLIDERTLLDLSADQISRPHRGMTVPEPIVLPWNAELTEGVSDEGMLIMYRRPDKPDTSFRSSPDWRLKERRAAIVSELVRLARVMGADR